MPSSDNGKATLHLVGRTDVLPVLSHVSHLLEKALDEGETMENVTNRLLGNTAQLWVSIKGEKVLGAWVTELVHKADSKYCNIWLVGGRKMDTWISNVDIIEEWASEQGCIAVTVERGRPGWQRINDTYKVTAVYLRKDL